MTSTTTTTLEDWETYFRDTPNPQRTDSIFQSLVLADMVVPNEFRQRIWQVLIPRTPPVEHYYSVLVEYALSLPNDVFEQIDKDLPRSSFSTTPVPPATIVAMKRVLMAYTIRNPLLSYIQGMNSVTYQLLHVLSEEDAFWGLCFMVEEVLYQHQLETGLDVLYNMVHQNIPNEIRQMGKNQDIEPSLEWIPSCYIGYGISYGWTNVSKDDHTFLQILDRVLYEKQVGLFKISVAVFQNHYQPDIPLFKHYEQVSVKKEALRLPESKRIRQPIETMHKLLFFQK